MKNLFIASCTLLLFFFTCCKKSDNRQYSYWYVNKDSFSSNNISLDIGKAIAVLQCLDSKNNFTIGFHFPYLPTNGTFPILLGSSHNPDSVNVVFYCNDKYYIPFKDCNLLSSSNNGKSMFTLAPVWYKNYYNPNDSVLIHGTFNEP